MQKRPGTTPAQNQEAELIRLFSARRFAELERAARAIVRLQPAHGFAWKALAAALSAQGKDALAAFKKASSLMPQDAESHNNLGTALLQAGDTENALASYRQALALAPGFADARANLVRLLAKLGRIAEALSEAQAWTELQPQSAAAHTELGNLLRAGGNAKAAISSYQRVLALGGAEKEACVNLGAACLDVGDYSAAITYGEKAVALAPDLAEAHFNLGNALSGFGRVAEATPAFTRAIALRPDSLYFHHNLLFCSNYLPYPAKRQLAEARRYGQLAAAGMAGAKPYTAWQVARDAGKPLRIGLVSNDLRRHPVGYFLSGVLRALAAEAAGRLEFHAYANHAARDDVTEKIRSCCAGWREVHALSDAELAAAVHADAIDILLDLGGHTIDSRLDMFAWKPAPVQAAWLGYFATTGLSAIDYLIADRHTLPPGEDGDYVERIWRLPETRLCFSEPDADIAVGPLPAHSNGYVTFGCFNNLSKINDAVVALWARILHALPHARLFLKNKQFADEAALHYLASRFTAHGIAAERLIFEGPSSREAYLQAHKRIDIALDPFPYTGGTTTAEALWMGVPVLTLAGERFLARQSAGLLANAGLADWIARDADDYVEKAIRFAGNTDNGGLAGLRRRLRGQVLASPVFDARRFARHFEQALRGMWNGWCDSRSG